MDGQHAADRRQDWLHASECVVVDDFGAGAGREVGRDWLQPDQVEYHLLHGRHITACSSHGRLGVGSDGAMWYSNRPRIQQLANGRRHAEKYRMSGTQETILARCYSTWRTYPLLLSSVCADIIRGCFHWAKFTDFYCLECLALYIQLWLVFQGSVQCVMFYGA